MSSPRALSSTVSTIASPLATIVRPARSVLRWPVESQQRSRRNAMLAATDLTDRRRETLLVEEHLAAHAKRWAVTHPAHRADHRADHRAEAEPAQRRMAAHA